MKLLVIGDHPETGSLVDILGSDNRRCVAHFPNDTTAIDDLRRHPANFDWVLLEKGPKANRTLTVRSLRAAGIKSPIAYLSFEGSSNSESDYKTALVCAVERTARGERILNCLLATPGAAPDAPAYPETPEILFEFHAPCNTRRDRRHGREAANG